jgi:hypothetical protein
MLIQTFVTTVAYLYHFSENFPPISNINGDEIPDNAYQGLFQDVFNTKLHLYDWFNENKVEQAAFHRLMAARPSSDGTMWTEYIPEEWFRGKFLSAEARYQEFTFVDIGASSGYVLNAIMQRLPKLHVRLILQDLPEVTKERNRSSIPGEAVPDTERHIEKMGHNFFDKQPIRGASVYILARVLHNWPDKEASLILRHIHAAMDHKSTLLIHECVFSDKLEEVSYQDAISDMTMMAALSSLERSEGQFRKLLSSAGLSLISVWRSSSTESKQAILEVIREG